MKITMRRFCPAAVLIGVLVSGCDVVVGSGPANPGAIPATQFLRPVRDEVTGTWVAAWIDPENYLGPGSAEEN